MLQVRAHWAALPQATCSSERIVVTDTIMLTSSRFIGAKGAQPGDTLQLQVLEHKVGSNLHYTALLQRLGVDPQNLPILMMLHPGDEGADISTQKQLMANMPPLNGAFVTVYPSFRAEAVTYEGEEWLSQGQPSPWDGDVDDALASLACAEKFGYGANKKPALIGMSRGAGVALLAVARDPSRWDFAVDFFGPTDFLSADMRRRAEAIFAGSELDLPGVDWLASNVIEPWQQESISDSAARFELIKRSSAYMAEASWPEVLMEHGTADTVVDIAHSRLMLQKLKEVGVVAKLEEWRDVGHTPLGMDVQQPLQELFARW